MCWVFGALAQMGERLLCKHQVIGSIPIGSTNADQIFPEMKTLVCRLRPVIWGIVPLFDIVNGF
jgi:hypothetical protein